MRVDKPWGWYEVVAKHPTATVKILCINQGQRLSNQYHMGRSEYLVAFAGSGVVDIGIKPGPTAPVARHLLRVGLAAFVPAGHVHRIICSPDSSGPLMISEVWMGERLDEGDIVRLQDDYGRDCNKDNDGRV